MKSRRYVSAVLNDFTAEIIRLKKLDQDSQQRLSSSLGRPTSGSFTKKQVHIITESLFFSAFRAYESLIEDVFLLYAMGKKPLSGRRPKSYLKTKDFDHAASLIKSSMYFLDWTASDALINRAELYLKDGYPIKAVITANQTILKDLKRIRNHIAHNSRESSAKYQIVLRNTLTTIPVKIPEVGEYLLMTDRQNRPNYYLITYINHIERIGTLLCG